MSTPIDTPSETPSYKREGSTKRSNLRKGPRTDPFKDSEVKVTETRTKMFSPIDPKAATLVESRIRVLDSTAVDNSSKPGFRARLHKVLFQQASIFRPLTTSAIAEQQKHVDRVSRLPPTDKKYSILSRLDSPSIESASPYSEPSSLTTSTPTPSPISISPANDSASTSSTTSKLRAYQALITELSIETYSPQVQNKIIHCYRTRDPILNLSRCGLETIPSCISTHEGLRHLTEINLSYNKIADVNLELKGVTYINLSHNKIEKFSAKIPRLTRLLLSHNRLSNFSGKFPRLKTLILSHNLLSSFSLTHNSLTSLQLSHNHLTRFDGRSLPRLENLYLTHNLSLRPSDITNIPDSIALIQDDFTSLRIFAKDHHLEDYSLTVQKKIMDCFNTKNPTLDLSHCELKKVPRCLSEMAFITDLNLSHNQLSRFPSICLFVEKLNLSGNKFKTFSVDTAQLPELRDLDISENNLESFKSESSFITTLNLSKNALKEATITVLNAANLTSLNISSNDLTSLLSPEAPNLRMLNIKNNKLKGNLLISRSFTKLRVLNASHNKINTIDLASMPRLQSLLLAHNRLVVLPITQYNSPALTHLDIRDNYLPQVYPTSQLPSTQLKQDTPQETTIKLIKFLQLDGYSRSVQTKIIDCFLSRSDTLDLSGCDLKMVPPCISTKLTVTHLDLSHNQLTEVPNTMKSLQDINLSHNQFVEFQINPGELRELKKVDLSYNMVLPPNIHIPSHRKITLTTEPVLQASREQLVHILNLSKCNKKAQNRIIQCFLSQSHDLDLSDCALSTIPSCISSKLRIKHLNLSNNQLTKYDLMMPHLETLNLSSNQFSEFFTDEKLSPHLSSLDLSDNPISISDIQLTNLDIIPEISDQNP